jgi:pimeloyl-ACP methyl ester carboxylesterase
VALWEFDESVTVLLMNSHAMVYDSEGQGVPLVFIHEVTTDRRLWHHQRNAFSQRYRLITVDVLGHGEARWPSLEEFSLERAADHVQDLLGRLDAYPAFVIGVSMGAAVAMHMAFKDPLLVRGLILVSPWNYMSEDTRYLVDRLFRLAEAGSMTAHTGLFLRIVLSTVYLERHASEIERLRAMTMEQDAHAVAYAWAACLVSDLTEKLGKIQAPGLVIAGLNDLLTPPYLARSVAEGLAEVELEIWEEAGHFPFLEDPARFNHRLESFVRRCLTQARSE